MTRRAIVHGERTVEMAHNFLAEVRRDLEKAAVAGCDLPPRVRTVHLRPGHATPEYRTLAIPVPPGGEARSPETLSSLIARFAAVSSPSCMFLALDGLTETAEGTPGAILIAEARDAGGTRLYWMQPFVVRNARLEWGEPLAGGWQEPGDQELILDASFAGVGAPPLEERPVVVPAELVRRG